MAIRLRIVDGTAVALCAAKTVPEVGDIYLDDRWHYAISQKYWRDYEEIDIVDEDDARLASAIERISNGHRQSRAAQAWARL